MSASAPLLQVSNLHKAFTTDAGTAVRAVDGVSLHIDDQETLAIVGESGCGKSTLARLLPRLIEPDSGDVMLRGRSIMGLKTAQLRAVRRQLQMVFQDPQASLNPRQRVGDALRQPLLLHGLANRAQAQAQAQALLEMVGLNAADYRRFPHEFSGGQKQRIGIARALAVRPELVICDEPVSALDVSIQAQIIKLLQQLQARLGVAYMFITHDLVLVNQIADRVAVMYLGRIVESGRVEHVFAQPQHPYTQALLQSVPTTHPTRRDQQIPLSGEPPNPSSPPSGCRFRTRCPFASAQCASAVPPEHVLSDEHRVACHHHAAAAAAYGRAAQLAVPQRQQQRIELFRARQAQAALGES